MSVGREGATGRKLSQKPPPTREEPESPGGSYLYSGKGLDDSDQVLLQ